MGNIRGENYYAVSRFYIMSTMTNFIWYLMYSGADGILPSALFVTYQTQGSYDIRSFDSAFPAVAE